MPEICEMIHTGMATSVATVWHVGDYRLTRNDNRDGDKNDQCDINVGDGVRRR